MARNLASLVMIVTSLSLSLGHTTLYAADQEPQTSYDHLVKVESKKVKELYLKQGETFADYDRMLLAVADVAFRKNAYRSQFASRNQMEKGIAKASDKLQVLFDDTFREVINEKGDFKFTNQRSESTLLVVPKLINVYLTTLDEASSTSSMKTYAESAGEMTLVLELYDSVSGEILARIVDHKQATDWGKMVRQSSTETRHQSRRMVKGWASDLNDGLIESAQRN
ncbi:DUF3313 domain-containing protein [Neiella marina]|uniref:DUF3313 domain-containing protein n=1 Tax=Neiella holothuriorum TaxID=2870530 RepID=A0ABS7ECF0_9GAMM|nr:DUF3313 family protein [Neiella holothuriorum]MBW8189638.1 DUF3313 domain-containing protein [Neiella holothuriorum]